MHEVTLHKWGNNETYRRNKDSECNSYTSIQGKWQAAMLVSTLRATKKRTDISDLTCTQANILVAFLLTTARDRCWRSHWRSLGSPDISIPSFLNKLQGTFNQCSPAVKNILFHAYCIPMYDACQLWSKYAQASMKSLCAAYKMPTE